MAGLVDVVAAIFAAEFAVNVNSRVKNTLALHQVRDTFWPQTAGAERIYTLHNLRGFFIGNKLFAVVFVLAVTVEHPRSDAFAVLGALPGDAPNFLAGLFWMPLIKKVIYTIFNTRGASFRRSNSAVSAIP